MTFDEYINSIAVQLGNVKIGILRRLWAEGVTFPRGWVRSAELLALTKQKYFDRRVRELRDQVGCQIETGMDGGEHAYRLLSQSLAPANLRTYLNDSQKSELFSSANFMCAVCGRRFEPGVRGLQADHRVPLKRGGSDDISNWQPLCVECNVGKRRACVGCSLDCSTCSWAFPQALGRRLVIQVPAALESSLRQYSEITGQDLSSCVAEAITQYLTKK